MKTQSTDPKNNLFFKICLSFEKVNMCSILSKFNFQALKGSNTTKSANFPTSILPLSIKFKYYAGPVDTNYYN